MMRSSLANLPRIDAPDRSDETRIATERRALLRERIVVVGLDDDRVPKWIRMWLETDARTRLGVG